MSVNKMWMNKCVQSTKFYTVVKMKELEIHVSLCVYLKNSVEQKHQVVGYIKHDAVYIVWKNRSKN